MYAPPSTPIPSSALYFGFTSLAMDAAVSWARAPGVSASAAAAVAAHDVLVAYFPASTALLDDDLAATLSTISGGRAKRTGIAVGRAAAAALVASRHGDGRNAAIVYSRNPAPGIWQPPPTGMAVPWLGFVKPLVLRTRITVDGPDPIGSAAYAADFDEVKRLGSATSTERTAAQTATAKFFNANSVLQLRQALLDHLERNPLSLARTTRLFAALDAATADALIQGWRLKYDDRLLAAVPGHPGRRFRRERCDDGRSHLDAPRANSAVPGLRERPCACRLRLHGDRGPGTRR